MERFTSDAKVTQIYARTNQIQRVVMAKRRSAERRLGYR